MLDQFAFIGILLIVALIFGIAPPALAFFLRPKKPDHRKAEVRERGVQTRGRARIETPVKAPSYVLALAFVVFDVAAMFLLPWALAYHGLGFYAVIEAIIFILILLSALVHVWRRGALE